MDSMLEKRIRVNRNRFAKRLVVAAGFFFLCAAPKPGRAQSGPENPAPRAVPMPRTQNGPSAASAKAPIDVFAGLKYTDEQKARIDQVHQNMKLRLEAVVKDDKLDADQKHAMLEGYARMERGQIFKLLAPEQQKEVLKKIRGGHEAAQGEKKQQLPPQ
jgi:hypothetical protein